jgi:predicted acetyltransferase
MNKVLLTNNDLVGMIRHCYESDVEHMMKYLLCSDQGLEFCIYKSVADFIANNITIYSLFDNNNFVGYFGEEPAKSDKFLTGFFIMPEYRKTLKKEFFHEIVKHFNGKFKAALPISNKPAQNFLLKNGCEIMTFVNNGVMFEYKGAI